MSDKIKISLSPISGFFEVHELDSLTREGVYIFGRIINTSNKYLSPHSVGEKATLLITERKKVKNFRYMKYACMFICIEHVYHKENGVMVKDLGVRLEDVKEIESKLVDRPIYW